MPPSDLAGPAGSVPPDFSHLLKEPRKDIIRDTAGYVDDIQKRTEARYAGATVYEPPTEWIPPGEMSPRDQPGAAASSKPADPYRRAQGSWSEWDSPKGDSWARGDWQWEDDDDKWQDFRQSQQAPSQPWKADPKDAHWKSGPNDSYDSQAPWKRPRTP